MSVIKYRDSVNDPWQELTVIVGPQGPAGADGTNGTNGTDGVGIASVVMNNDYTLTITLTNNQSYTTSSIRGAQGEPGATGATGPQGPQGETGPAGSYTAGTNITIENGVISAAGGNYPRKIIYSNLSDTTSEDYAFMNSLVNTYYYQGSIHQLDWTNGLFVLQQLNMIYYPLSVIYDNDNNNFLGIRLIAGLSGGIYIKKLLYSNGAWSLANETSLKNYTAGTGISITNGVIALDLTNANGVSY